MPLSGRMLPVPVAPPTAMVIGACSQAADAWPAGEGLGMSFTKA